MDLKLPPLGEGADSGTVVTLFVREGDAIVKGQPILELENEKAVATIPATAGGTVGAIFVKPGDKIGVGQRILTLGETGVADTPRVVKPEPRGATRLERMIQTPSPQQAPASAEEFAEGLEGKPGAAPAAAPSIRIMARELGIDLTQVRGSARGGRIILEDVRAYIQQLQRLAQQPKTAVAKSTAEQVDFSKWGPVSRTPLTPLRQVIARRMAEAWNTVPRVTQFDEADITALDALRKKYATAYQQKGARLTLTAFALKVVADALKRHPIVNSSLEEAAQEVVLKAYYHIGVAVDTEAGLIVPVIRDVDRKSMIELSRELEALAAKARERRLTAEELKGGTFTISNQGGIGGGHFTPIVNKPEVAILGLGRGALKPVARAGGVEPRLVLPLGLSYDHRVIDGAGAVRFMVDLVKGFETFPEEGVRI